MKLLLLSTLALYLITNSINAISATENSQPRSTPITVVKAKQLTLIEATKVRGEIESLKTPHVAAKVAAEVTNIYVDDGIRVTKAQLLAQLDDEAFLIAEEKAKADILRLEAFNENQFREVARHKELFKKKLISQSVLDNVLTKMKQIEAELLGAKARLREARYKLSHTQIISPMDGIIQQRFVSEGDYVKVGNQMFHIVAMENLRARIYLPDSLGTSVVLGMKVELFKNNQTQEGTITQIRPMMENGTRSLHALVNFENSNKWKPGTSISANIVLAEHQQAVAVPLKTIIHRPAGLVVYEVKGNRVVERIVSIGIKQANLVEILSGINAGDTIVLDGASWLTDGAYIDIQQGNN